MSLRYYDGAAYERELEAIMKEFGANRVQAASILTGRAGGNIRKVYDDVIPGVIPWPRSEEDIARLRKELQG